MGIRRTIRNTLPELLDHAREMRADPTPAEEILWEELRSRTLNGLKFRRQHTVNAYILDFWCPACKLAIELDGSAHDTPEAQEYDAIRQQHLESFGYTVLRFRNEQVLEDTPGVLQQILAAARPAAPTDNRQ
jgi:very-short-patch-repair endonuclease